MRQAARPGSVNLFKLHKKVRTKPNQNNIPHDKHQRIYSSSVAMDLATAVSPLAEGRRGSRKKRNKIFMSRRIYTYARVYTKLYRRDEIHIYSPNGRAFFCIMNFAHAPLAVSRGRMAFGMSFLPGSDLRE